MCQLNNEAGLQISTGSLPNAVPLGNIFDLSFICPKWEHADL